MTSNSSLQPNELRYCAACQQPFTGLDRCPTCQSPVVRTPLPQPKAPPPYNPTAFREGQFGGNERGPQGGVK